MTEKNIPDVLFLRPKAKVSNDLSPVGASAGNFAASPSTHGVAFSESYDVQAESPTNQSLSFEQSLPADVQRWLKEKTHASASLQVDRSANQMPSKVEVDQQRSSGAVPNPHAQFLPKRKERPATVSPVAQPVSQEIDQEMIDDLFLAARTEAKTLPSITDHFATTVSPALINGLRPAWRVPKFEWPKITDQMVQANAKVFADLVTRFEQSTQRAKVLGVVGTRGGCGVSSLAYVATRVFAEAFSMPQPSVGVANNTVGENQLGCTLLIDANLQRPMLAADLGLYTRNSWADLHGQVPGVADATVCDLEGRIHLLPLNCAIAETGSSKTKEQLHPTWQATLCRCKA